MATADIEKAYPLVRLATWLNFRSPKLMGETKSSFDDFSR
jgi:hypothetical protein